MAIQVQGNGGVVAEVDGTDFRALRITPRPTDFGVYGHYSWAGFTGILPAALAGNSEIFQFRWADATRLAIIEKVVISACVTTTFFVAGVPVQIDMIKSTSWSAQGTGGTSVTMGTNGKERTSMGSSLVQAGDMRIATTAALGAGTKTFDGYEIGALAATGPTAAPSTIVPPFTTLYEANEGEGQHPLVLVQNEGFSVRSVAVPATGTWQATVQVRWAEAAAF